MSFCLHISRFVMTHCHVVMSCHTVTLYDIMSELLYILNTIHIR